MALREKIKEHNDIAAELHRTFDGKQIFSQDAAPGPASNWSVYMLRIAVIELTMTLERILEEAKSETPK